MRNKGEHQVAQIISTMDFTLNMEELRCLKMTTCQIKMTDSFNI
jgi:hypothetical protein